MTLKLNLMAGYWSAHPPQNFVEMAQLAERLGYYGFFTAEAWGSDALTPLAWVGAQTSKIKLGTAIAQISARTPTSLAMHAMTLDHLSNGRMILGLGVSGPQVVEGWYGQGFSKPLSRTRAYIDIIRQVMARDQPVQHQSDLHPAISGGRTGVVGDGQVAEVHRASVAPGSADLPWRRRAEEREDGDRDL